MLRQALTYLKMVIALLTCLIFGLLHYVQNQASKPETPPTQIIYLEPNNTYTVVTGRNR